MYGGKTVENRTRGVSYRGLLAIHAGRRWSERGAGDSRVLDAFAPWLTAHQAARPPDRRIDSAEHRERFELGAIIAVVDLVGSHLDMGCCRPWGESAYDEHGGRRRTEIHHLVLENVRPLAEPVPCRGMLGLFTPKEPNVVADVLAAIR